MSSKPKKEPWRIIVFVLAVICIVFLWVRKDIGERYAAMPLEEVLPLIATTAAVSLAKAAAIAGGILLIKWLAGKIGKK